VKAKYDEMTYDIFTELFQALPLAYCINNKILVLHGGLFSEDNVTLDDIRKIHRFQEPGEKGICKFNLI
jgi:serine/threonine-protein phosphatase 5